MNEQTTNPIGPDIEKVPQAPNSASGANRTSLSRVRPRQTGARQLAVPVEFSLNKLFWWLVAALLGYCAITSPGRPFVFTFSALLIAFFTLVPAYLWCHRMVAGLPIFPIFAGTFVLTHALQFMLAEPQLREHPDDSIWRAALTVSGFLFTATLVWLFWVRLPNRLPPSCRMLKVQRGTDFLYLILAASTVVTIFDHAGWLTLLPGGATTLIINFFRGPTAFAVFILALRWGSRTLRPGQISLFVGLFIAYCVADASSIFVVAVVIMSLMLVLGFIIGRQSVPWFWFVPLVAIVAFLHIGKGEMRSRYWAEGTQGNFLEPWKYPSFYAEWLATSTRQMTSQKQGGEKGQSVFSRVNTVYLLLQAQEMAPTDVPFLKGATYAIIPSALVPRIFNSGKTSPHDSTSLLNVEFGNQTWEATQSTSIGWGLLNESYANFGYAGCLALAVILGTFYGLVTRSGIGLPPTSLSALVGIFTLAFTVQTEMTAAIYITSYLQGLFALLVMAYPISELRPMTIEGWQGENVESRRQKSEDAGRWTVGGGRRTKTASRNRMTEDGRRRVARGQRTTEH